MNDKFNVDSWLVVLYQLLFIQGALLK